MVSFNAKKMVKNIYLELRHLLSDVFVLLQYRLKSVIEMKIVFSLKIERTSKVNWCKPTQFMWQITLESILYIWLYWVERDIYHIIQLPGSQGNVLFILYFIINNNIINSTKAIYHRFLKPLAHVSSITYFDNDFS